MPQGADYTRESVESGRRESNSHYQLGKRMGGCVDRDSHKDWVASEHWPMTVIDPHLSHADRTACAVFASVMRVGALSDTWPMIYPLSQVRAPDFGFG